jgi:hypothetical protein
MHGGSTHITLRPLGNIESTLPLTPILSFGVGLLTFHDRIGDYKFGQLLECVDFNWYAVSVTDYPKGTYPHFKVIVESEVNGDDRLLRGEIMTITDIMTARLKTDVLNQHIVVPVGPFIVDSKWSTKLALDTGTVSHGPSPCSRPGG